MGISTLGPPLARDDMAKKKPKATLYVEIDADLKRRVDKSAEKNGRKLVSEVSIALEFYLAAQGGELTQPVRPADEEC